VLLPAAVRRVLGLRTGSGLRIEVEQAGRVPLVPVDDAWARAQALFDGVQRTGSVVDELLAERRTEAAAELG